MVGKEKVCLWELTVEGEDERVGGTNGSRDQEVRGVCEVGFDEWNRVEIGGELKVETA